MMDRILRGLFCLSGFTILSCQSHQYHFVDSPMTWTQAKAYCRQEHTDQATVVNKEENDRLLAAVPSHYKSDFWIGLYSKIEWRWSDGYNGSGADYRHWETSPQEPDFYSGDQYCVEIRGTGKWGDIDCKMYTEFICYTDILEENSVDPKKEFIRITEEKNWFDAQKYCRENYIDLATVRNDAENQKLQDFTTTTELGWIGLYREPNIHWSDGNGSMFTYWAEGANPLASMTAVCGFVDLKESGKWKVRSCEERLPFACYGPDISPTQTSRTKHVLKLKIEPDSSVDLNDPAVKADILKNLQDRLKVDGLSGVTLKWRIQPDGKVFHKERKCTKMENRERPSSEDEKCDL